MIFLGAKKLCESNVCNKLQYLKKGLNTINQIFIVLTSIIKQKLWKVEINIDFSCKKLENSGKMGVYLDSKFDGKSSFKFGQICQDFTLVISF